MGRQRLEPRLYLDPNRRTWIIRDGQEFVRTGLAEADRERAEEALQRYLVGEMPTTQGEKVYFIRAHNRVKIGRSLDVKQRFDALQSMSPIKLKLLWAQPGGAETEIAYHRQFSECRLHGEWFEIRGPLREFLAKYGLAR